jgi:hypothetical protein
MRFFNLFVSRIYVDKSYRKTLHVNLKKIKKQYTKLYLNLNSILNPNTHSLLLIKNKYSFDTNTNLLIVNFFRQEYQLILIDILKVCLILSFDLVCCWSSFSSLFTLFRVKTNIGIIVCVKVRSQLTIQKIIHRLKKI